MREFEELDENIPQEVLNDESWSPRLLPELGNFSINFGFEDIVVNDEDDVNEDE